MWCAVMKSTESFACLGKGCSVRKTGENSLGCHLQCCVAGTCPASVQRNSWSLLESYLAWDAPDLHWHSGSQIWSAVSTKCKITLPTTLLHWWSSVISHAGKTSTSHGSETGLVCCYCGWLYQLMITCCVLTLLALSIVVKQYSGELWK